LVFVVDELFNPELFLILVLVLLLLPVIELPPLFLFVRVEGSKIEISSSSLPPPSLDNSIAL
jgi:hypothetical protein